MIGRMLKLVAALFALSMPAFALAANPYQIGDEWGKMQVTADTLKNESQSFVRAALATGKYSGATSFYLGKFKNRHLIGTNHHVQRNLSCQGKVEFVMLGASGQCTRVLGSWPEIDFALIEISVDQDSEGKLAPVGRNFAFYRPIQTGTSLITIGFGGYQNSARNLMASQDDDCKVFSGDDEFKKMGDPDSLNPGSYQAWSFANGCDVSHGDSGSAMIDRSTGEVLGLLWTGRVPKAATIQDSKHLAELLKKQGPEIWTQLTYSVPAAKIREVLLGALKRDDTATPALDPAAREAIEALVTN